MKNLTLTSADRLPLPPKTPHRIQSEEEALRIAQRLAHDFRQSAAQRDRERILPWDELERYTASGLGSITVPRKYGGLDTSYETLARIFVMLCAADASLGQIPQNHFAVIQNLRDNATEAQQRRWFADVLNGHRLGNAGPERKSQAAVVNQATAKVSRTRDGLRVDGTRFYSTGALFAHWIPFRAQDDAGRPVQVLVRRDATGVRVVDDWDAFGQKTTASGSVILDNVAIQEDDVVQIWRNADKANLSGPVSQLIQASIDAGIAQEALRDALHFVRERSRPWVDANVASADQDPYIIQEVGKLQTEVDAAFEVLLESAHVLDGLKHAPVITPEISARASVAVAQAKILTTEAALNASEQLFALAGSAATRAAHNLDRHWRNARVHTLHDPVRWKYHLLGNYVLNGALPKRHQWN